MYYSMYSDISISLSKLFSSIHSAKHSAAENTNISDTAERFPC